MHRSTAVFYFRTRSQISILAIPEQRSYSNHLKSSTVAMVLIASVPPTGVVPIRSISLLDLYAI